MDLMLGLTDIKTIVRDLWTLRLSKLLSRLESPQRGDSESQATPPAEDSGDGAPERSAKRGGKGLESPKLVETIALCYMGMLILRLPVGLGELYRSVVRVNRKKGLANQYKMDRRRRRSVCPGNPRSSC